MNKRLKQGFILFALLVFPSLFYVILSGSNHDIVGLPYYGPKEHNEAGDTIYYEVQGLNMLKVYATGNELGEALQSKVKIVSFIDFSPESYRVMEQMQNLHDRFRDKPDVLLITVALKQPADSLLSALKNTYAISQKHWYLLESPVNLAAQLKIDQQNVVEASGNHVITLIDQDNRIRGYFDGIQYVDTKEIREAVKALRFKNYRPVKTRKTDEGE